MRILIIGINYSPEETGIAPYTTGLAEHLVDQGHNVTVVTGLPNYPQWQVQRGFRGMLWRRTSEVGVEVLRRWHYVPRTQTPVRRAMYEATFLMTGLSALFLPPPHVILGIVPSLSGGILARLASQRYSRPYLLLFQDLVGLAAIESGIHVSNRMTNAIHMAEIWAARRATALAIIAEGFRDYLVAAGVDSARISRVRNWTHVDKPTMSKHQARTQLGLPQDRIVCLHAGNMGYKQGLENVVECAQLAEHIEERLLFVLMGDGSQRRKLEEDATRYRLSNVKFLPVIPRELLSSALASADILLLNQRSTVRSMALPGKLTSYFAAGRPVVAAVAPGSEAAEEVRASEGGVLVPPDDPHSLLAAISQLSKSSSTQEALGISASRYAQRELTAEQALARLREILERVAEGEHSKVT